MNQAPPKDRRPEPNVDSYPDAQESRPQELREASSLGLKDAVETAAKAYFGTCRKIARAITRLKKGS